MSLILMAEMNARWAASNGLLVASNGPCTCASASIRVLEERTAVLVRERMLVLISSSCSAYRHAGTTGMMCSDEHHISVMQGSVAVCMFLTS